VILPAFTANSGQPTAAVSAVRSAAPSRSNSLELGKLNKAAGEFEAMLLQTLWKSMKGTFSDPDDPNADPTLENFDDLGMQSLSGAVGNSGALGIKGMILKYLEPTVSSGSSANAAE